MKMPINILNISNPDLDELSSKLFQLGHEHEISNGIFDIGLPNRAACP